MKLSIPQMALMSRLLDEALPLDAAGRRVWLERLSPEYQDLVQALREALLAGDSQAAGSEAVGRLPKFASADEADVLAASGLHAGARVGPYELIRALGAGGMAQVWLACRADGAFKREVALKLPKLTRLRADLEQRFARERDILASLEHPQIARFYDAGIDANGLPYVAMEYVHGEPLTDWCDAHRLPISARLELLVQVLGAVQYAHEKHVIHRDLKPSNILVTESGQVRLLDFGVAKLLEAEEGEKTPLTGVYGRALTPDYASPELLRGDPVDPRSDVYSLGVVLYELLTGVLPYRLKSAASIGLLEQAVAMVEVKKPSTQIEPEAIPVCGTTPKKLANQLRGDLDAIALKALAKAPAERYPSAAALAQDLRRYLEGKPIEAQPARFPYRLRKFIRRNKAMVGISAMAVVAMLAAAGYSLYREAVFQVKVTANAVPVLQNAIPEKSIAVLPFTDMSEQKDQEYFADGLAEELIDLLANTPGLRVIARTSSFSFKAKSDDIPTIAAKLKVANILEGSVRKSGKRLRVSTQLVRAVDGQHVWSETYDRELKDVFEVQDDIAGSVVKTLKLKLSPRQESPPSRSANTDAYLQYLLGQQYLSRGSANDLRRAVAAYRSAIALDSHYAAAYAGLAVAEAFLADAIGDTAEGGLERASAAAERAIELAPDQAPGYTARGFLRSLLTWDWTGAEADFAKAFELAPNDATVLHHYSGLLSSLGRLPEAVRAARTVADLDPFSERSWQYLAGWLMQSGDLGAAREACRHGLAIDPENAFILATLGYIELLAHKPAEALTVFQRIPVDEPERVGFRLTGIAMAEHSLGHAKESKQALDEVVAKTAQLMAFQMAEAHAWRGEPDKAFEWLERAYRQRDGGLQSMKVDPLLYSLHSDPRYKAMLKKINLPG